MATHAELQAFVSVEFQQPALLRPASWSRGRGGNAMEERAVRF